MPHNTTPIAVRLSNRTIEFLDQQANVTGSTRAEIVRDIIVKYFSPRSEDTEYPLRYQARLQRAALRQQGIKATVMGSRGRWRVERQQ